MRCLIVVMKFDIIKVHRIVFFTILIEVAKWQRKKRKKNLIWTQFCLSVAIFCVRHATRVRFLKNVI